ncbi:MAG: DUF92 domain-containing protein [Candidatus Paceibacterota bacterium]
MYRLVNYLFSFVIIYLFILEANMGDHIQIILGLLLSAIIAYVSFFGNWITLDATKAVVIFGTIIFGLAGWSLALAVLAFFISSNLLSRWNRFNRYRDPEEKFRKPNVSNRRDGYQIWANGFWIAIFTISWFLFQSDTILIVAFIALATATADTWATEIGTVKPGKTVKINTFTPIRPGKDGGVSIKGTVASAIGALLIACFVFMTGVQQPFWYFLIVLFFGFVGSLLDSYFGALISDKKWRLKVPNDFTGNQHLYSNSFVNWISTGLSAVLALIFIQMFF